MCNRTRVGLALIALTLNSSVFSAEKPLTEEEVPSVSLTAVSDNHASCKRTFANVAVAAFAAGTVYFAVNTLGRALYHSYRASQFAKETVDYSSFLDDEGQETKTILKEFLAGLTVEEAYNFGTSSAFGKLFFPEELKDRSVVTLPRLKQLAEELQARARFNTLYKEGVAKDQFLGSVRILISKMEGENVPAFFQDTLVTAADRLVEAAKKEGKVGELYTIQSVHHPRLISTWQEVVSIGAAEQKRIDDVFVIASSTPLTTSEQALVDDGKFTSEELRELKALRKATQYFEEATYLKNDLSGNLQNNVRTEIFGGKQQVCSDEAQTYDDFVATLGRRGLIRHFKSSGIISRADAVHSGHAATRLRRFRDSEEFVLDSWHEQGGTAAHVTTVKDWRAANDKNDLVSLLPDSK